MRISLFWKLFVVQLLAAATLLAGVLVMMRYQTATSFAAYVEVRERQRLEDVAERIADLYAQTGDLHRAALAVREFRRRGGRVPPPGGESDRRPPLRAPLSLLDANGEWIGGAPPPPAGDELRVTIGDDAQPLGFIARPALPAWIAPDEAGFTRRQTRALLLAAAIGLPVAALFAAFISGLVQRPIRRLSAGTAALARREFATRIAVDRSDELGRLATDFNHLAEALERYDGHQRQWLADVAHELRTPLAVLRGELEAMLDGVRAVGPEHLRSMQQEVQRLGTLTDDLHLLSLAESGGLRLVRENCDVATLLRDAESRFAERLSAAGFDVVLQAPEVMTVNADVQRLDQVLGNLLENSLRHARPPGPIKLGAVRSGSSVQIVVSDAGPGVPAEALPRLFDRLYRVESARSRDGGGTGLGLAICRSIVEAHGGSITAEAAEGGLRIVFELPLVTEASV